MKFRWPWSSSPQPPAAPTAGVHLAGDPRLSGLSPLAGVTHFDQWINPYTGLGGDRDKVYQGMYYAPVRLSDTELLALYNGSDIAAKICETRPKEMLRRGFELEGEPTDEDDDDGDVSEDDLKQLKKYGEKLFAIERIQEAAVWANCFGGALVIVGAEDGQPMDQPLAEENIRTVRFLNMVDRRFVFAMTYYNDPLKPNYGYPETYRVSSTISGSGSPSSEFIIHESRVIRFDGARTDVLTRLQLAGWSWSVLQRAYEQMRNFDSTFQAVGALVSDASQAVFKVQNLISMLTSNEKDVLQSRMQMVDMSRSVCRAVMVDAENEEFERTSTSFAGLPDILDRFMMRLSAAVDIPVSILLGRSAAGMNATGEGDFRAFYDSVADDQVHKMGPKLTRLYHILALAKDSPMEGRDIEVKIKFANLMQPSDPEQADIELKAAQKDQIYATLGAVEPNVIALSRWGKGTFNGSGMSAFDPKDAEADRQNDKMMSGMVSPPPEIVAKKKGPDGGAAGGQGPVQLDPNDPNAPPQPPGAPIGAGASPFGQGNNPVRVLANLHQAPKADGSTDQPRDENGRWGEAEGKADAAFILPPVMENPAEEPHIPEAPVGHDVAQTAVETIKPPGGFTHRVLAAGAVHTEHRSEAAAVHAANKLGAGHPFMIQERNPVTGDWEESKHPRDENGKFV